MRPIGEQEAIAITGWQPDQVRQGGAGTWTREISAERLKICPVGPQGVRRSSGEEGGVEPSACIRRDAR